MSVSENVQPVAGYSKYNSSQRLLHDFTQMFTTSNLLLERKKKKKKERKGVQINPCNKKEKQFCLNF